MTRHYVVGWVWQDKPDDAPHLRAYEQFRGAEEARAWINALPGGVRWRVYELVEVPGGDPARNGED